MFKSLRHLLIAGLLSMVAAAIGAGMLQRQQAIEDLGRLGEAGNVAITRLLAGTVGEDLPALLAAAPSATALDTTPQSTAVRDAIRTAVQGTDIVQVRVYTLDGRSVLSAMGGPQGEVQGEPRGIASARAGQAATRTTHHHALAALWSAPTGPALLWSHTPLRAGGSGPIAAVLEIQRDIAPQLSHIDATQRQLVFGSIAVLSLVFGVLLVVAARADARFRHQQSSHQSVAEALRRARSELERHVAELHRVGARHERTLALSKLSSDWFWDQDADFRFIDVDASNEQCGGLKPQAHMGRARWELPHTEPANTSWELHRAELAAHRPFRDLLLRRTAPTGLRYVNVCGEPVFAADGSFCGYRGVACDVTGRVQAEQSLMAARDALAERAAEHERVAFLQALVDALPVGVKLVDSNLELAVTNQAFARLLDLPPELLIQGTPVEHIYHHNAERGDFGPGDPQQLVAQRMAQARSRLPRRVDRRSRGDSTLESCSVPLPDGGIVTVYTDITERMNAEHELRVARDAAEAGSQAKSAFLAVMSHEIRTPMNAVIGLLELLRLSPLDREQCDTVDTVRDSSKSLLRLIDDVLDFSKIESGRLELQEEPASLVQMFDSAHQTFSGVASQKSVLLSRRVDPRIAAAVSVDRLRLRQVINNLLSNAIKFTERGRVELTADLVAQDEDSDQVRICVRDTGVGIDAAVLERLFEPFSQADASIERHYGGTGLGLAICKRLATLMGSMIEVKSVPGVGTCFSLTLSMRRSTAAALQEARPPAPDLLARAVQGRSAPTVEAARAAGRLVLVVDDHPINRRMLARQLNLLGHAVQTACDGRQALEMLQDGGVGVVVTDCQMPVMDGYELASAIRRLEGDGPTRLPIIACTANVAREALDQCRAVGMDEAITKPVELAALRHLLDRWLPHAAPTAAELPAAEAPLASEFVMLAELAQGDPALRRELLDDFRKANADDLHTASRAVHSAAADDLRRAAHRIKGAARTVGASRLADAAMQLEQAADAGDWGRVSVSWPGLQQESRRLDEHIASACP